MLCGSEDTRHAAAPPVGSVEVRIAWPPKSWPLVLMAQNRAEGHDTLVSDPTRPTSPRKIVCCHPVRPPPGSRETTIASSVGEPTRESIATHNPDRAQPTGPSPSTRENGSARSIANGPLQLTDTAPAGAASAPTAVSTVSATTS